MVEVKRKPRETTSSLIRRFSSKIRMSGVLRERKKRAYYKPPSSKREKKEKVLKKISKINRYS
jgi:ribosomal protein S21